MKQQKKERVLFLNLTAFSFTGGIEKFNKCLLKALYDLESECSIQCYSFSTHDNSKVDERYFPKKRYKGFAGNRIKFVLKSFFKARGFDQIILGHINLAIIGALIKIFFPKKRVIVIIHGIEVWDKVKGFKKFLLKKADLILTASNYTKSKLVKIQNVPESHIKLFYNTIDPYFAITPNFPKNMDLRTRYSVSPGDFVLFTLARLSHLEKYKGYDVVIKCLPDLIKSIPNLKYIIGGKYDTQEKERLDEMIADRHLEDVVTFTGFIKEEEIKDHYQMADVFIMPSHGEGFGIVFIEAMVFGLPVIAGNQNGSVDALRGGELGTLVNPNSTEEITKAVLEYFENHKNWTEEHKYNLQQKTLNYFGFEKYKQTLKHLLLETN